MKTEEIKEMINIALKSVEGIEDQKLKDKTYEIILSNLMNKNKNVTSNEPKEDIDSYSSTVKKVETGPISKIAEKFKIDPQKVEDYFEINNEDINILFPISLTSALEEHLYFSLILLTINKIVFEKSEIASGKLRESARLKGLKSLVNLSTNLKKYPEYIIHKHGKIGSTNSTYKLTLEGYNKGIEIITNILNEKSLFEVENTDKSVRKSKKSSGLTKELYKLCNEGFFNTPKTVKDAKIELKRRGFFNKRQDIDAGIRKVLMKSKKLLVREKKEGVWQYVIRK